MRVFRHWWLASLMAIFSFCSAAATAEELPETARFSPEQLEQLVAPIALYPDALVAQILMAATYPLQVVQASRWQQRNPHLQGDALDSAVLAEDWDPSVKSLLHFPDVLKRMDENLDWTQDLGDAVLIQQQEVMDTVQRMRRWAYASGTLRTTSQQTVVVEKDVIRVQPATEVVYVPAYNPVVVYGDTWRPSTYYYPVYTRPTTYWVPDSSPVSDVIFFGAGVAVGAALWGDLDWHDHHVVYHDYPHHWHDRDVNIDRSVTINNYNTAPRPQVWEHDPYYRQGVRYRDQATNRKYEEVIKSRPPDYRPNRKTGPWDTTSTVDGVQQYGPITPPGRPGGQSYPMGQGGGQNFVPPGQRPGGPDGQRYPQGPGGTQPPTGFGGQRPTGPGGQPYPGTPGQPPAAVDSQRPPRPGQPPISTGAEGERIPSAAGSPTGGQPGTSGLPKPPPRPGADAWTPGGGPQGPQGGRDLRGQPPTGGAGSVPATLPQRPSGGGSTPPAMPPIEGVPQRPQGGRDLRGQPPSGGPGSVPSGAPQRPQTPSGGASKPAMPPIEGVPQRPQGGRDLRGQPPSGGPGSMTAPQQQKQPASGGSGSPAMPPIEGVPQRPQRPAGGSSAPASHDGQRPQGGRDLRGQPPGSLGGEAPQRPQGGSGSHSAPPSSLPIMDGVPPRQQPQRSQPSAPPSQPQFQQPQRSQPSAPPQQQHQPPQRPQPSGPPPQQQRPQPQQQPPPAKPAGKSPPPQQQQEKKKPQPGVPPPGIMGGTS